MRREPLLAAVVCLAGAFLVLVAVGRAWALVDVGGGGLLPPRTVEVTGADLVPGVRALGLVALAGVVAIPATRGWGRVVVGLLLALVGAGVLASAIGVLGDLAAAVQQSDAVPEPGERTRRTGWPFACAVGGLVVAAAGLLVATRGRRWAALGRRYEAPAVAATGPAGERDLWEALDRGDDPTAPDPEGEGPTSRR